MMSDDLLARWPRFEIVRYEAPTGIPNGWDAELLEKGVPRGMMERYRAARRLMLVGDIEGREFVSFGRTMLMHHICLDPQTGQVIEVIRSRRRLDEPYKALMPAQLVNSGLDQFTTSVRVVIERFPFDDGSLVRERNQTDAEEDEEWRLLEAAVRDMRTLLLDIDPAPLAIDGFWSTFLDDVGIGDFMTPDVLSDEPPTIGIIHPDGTRKVKVVKQEWDGHVW
jgi:hypothetical protein